jgi:hypothetical protein
LTVGQLRNMAATFPMAVDAGIILHLDDDDWFHPNRIAEQVALLQSSGADVVGYNRMLFWREPNLSGEDLEIFSPGEAWIYTGEILGTSLAYWRKTWERTPFAANHVLNEDGGFVSEVRGKGGKVVAVDSICDLNPFPSLVINLQPRMIARIHAQNSSNPAYNPQQMAAHPRHWQRTPEFDSYCRRMM